MANIRECAQGQKSKRQIFSVLDYQCIYWQQKNKTKRKKRRRTVGNAERLNVKLNWMVTGGGRDRTHVSAQKDGRPDQKEIKHQQQDSNTNSRRNIPTKILRSGRKAERERQLKTLVKYREGSWIHSPPLRSEGTNTHTHTHTSIIDPPLGGSTRVA